jgi:hypothetical protein
VKELFVILDVVELGIIPYNKVLVPYDPGGGGAKGTAPTKPTFSSLQFCIPDPTQDTDIDPTIPWILCGYHAQSSLDNNTLTYYLKNYLFYLVVTGSDNNKYARVEFLDNKDLSKNPSMYDTANFQKIVDYWIKFDNDSFSKSGNDYCSANNLIIKNKDGWCYKSCGRGSSLNNILTCDTNLTAFCQSGPSGKYDNPDSVIQKGDSDDQILTKFPNSNNNICSNFMPQNYYQTKAINSAGKNQVALDIVMDAIAQGGYNIPECTGIGSKSTVKSASWYGSKQNCPSITTCVNLAEFVNDGTITGDITVTQATNCPGSGPPTPPAPTPPPSPPSGPSGPSGPSPTPPPGLSKEKKIVIITLTIITLSSFLAILFFLL